MTLTLAAFTKLYLATLAAFLLIDLTWLGLIASSFYRQRLGPWLSPQTNWLAAIIFYLLFVAGLLVFVIVPALQAGAPGRALLLGAFFGLVTYATYDLTNLATLKDWSLALTLVDLAWGATLSTLVSGIAYWIGHRFFA